MLASGSNVTSPREREEKMDIIYFCCDRNDSSTECFNVAEYERIASDLLKAVLQIMK